MHRTVILRAAVLGLAALTMFFLAPDAAFAAAPPATDPVSAGVGSAIERALGDQGAGEDTPLSMSLQLLACSPSCHRWC
jgi:flagellar biosynthesis protein FliP